MDREFKYINEILLKLNSTLLHPSKTLGELTLIPAGYMMFFMHLHLKYRCFPYPLVKEWDLHHVTGQDILDCIHGHTTNNPS